MQSQGSKAMNYLFVSGNANLETISKPKLQEKAERVVVRQLVAYAQVWCHRCGRTTSKDYLPVHPWPLHSHRHEHFSRRLHRYSFGRRNVHQKNEISTVCPLHIFFENISCISMLSFVSCEVNRREDFMAQNGPSWCSKRA